VPAELEGCAAGAFGSGPATRGNGPFGSGEMLEATGATVGAGSVTFVVTLLFTLGFGSGSLSVLSSRAGSVVGVADDVVALEFIPRTANHATSPSVTVAPATISAVRRRELL
jgi:hypothetical protein